MSMLTYTDLLPYPALVKWLAEERWAGDEHPSFPDDGEMIVESIRFAGPGDCDDGDILDNDLGLTAISRDKATGVRHQTTLVVFVDESEDGPDALDFFPYCSCAEGFSCSHEVAFLRKLTEIARGKTSVIPSLAMVRHDFDEWLKRLHVLVDQTALETPEPKPGKYNKFLAYCIDEDRSFRRKAPGAYCLVTRVGNWLKSGFSIESSIVQPDLNRIPKYVAPEDIAIVAKLMAWKSKHGIWSSAAPIDGPGWDVFLNEMLATGRLFVCDPGQQKVRSKTMYRPVTEGPGLTVEPAWKKLDDAGYAPGLSFPNDLTVLLPTEPLYYLDPVGAKIGRVHSQAPPRVLRAWTEGPVVPKAVLDEVSQAIIKLGDSVVLPVPDQSPPEILQGMAPTPILHIAEVRVGVYQKPHIGGLLQFRYADRVFFPLPENAPVTATWYEGDTRMVLERDAAAEASLARQLIDQGLVALHSLFRAIDLNEKNYHSVVIGQPSLSLEPWLEFINGPVANALRDQGWVIEADSRINLTIHDIRDFFPEIDTDADHGIDWFRFDVTAEFDGKKISLIPHIATAIREDWLERYKDPATRPAGLLLSCDDPSQGHIRFPAERFLGMVEQVRHLFHGISAGDGPLRMDRLQAAGIADALRVDSTETTRALAKLGKHLRDIQGVEPVPLPPTIRAELRPYQVDGFRWLQFLARNGLHGILADDMGLGKTLQTLVHLAAEITHAQGRPSLIIAPTSVVSNWAAETEKFAPSLKALVLYGADRGEHFDAIPDHDLVFTTYPLLARDFDILRKQDWHTIVLDEAQYIKNPKALCTQYACQLRAAHRICLSGTPMENHLGELWSLMRFLMPGFLADEKSFNTLVRKPIERDRSRDAQLALNRRVSPLILRRTKDQVAAELPEKTTLIHRIDLEGKQADLYESVRAAMDIRVRDALAEKGLAKSHIIVLDALLKLRQICCHPHLLRSEAAQRVSKSSKLQYLSQELLPTLLEENRRILLFSQFTSMLELIEEHLQREKIPYLKLTGQTKERASLVEQFQEGRFPIFLISLKAGGTGLNLTAADTVIHYDPWWNPAAENQATDRAHRIGQQKPVFVHKLVCTGTIEERILELQQHKASLVEALLSEETNKLKIDAETLSHLFSPIG